MSRKNHKMTDGKLLQMDKKYSHLKLKQKEKIAEWMYLETQAYYEKIHAFPGDKQIEEVIAKVYDRIVNAEIWIPYDEVAKHYRKKRADINKHVRRVLNQQEQTETACFMNLCMVQDGDGNVLALDKTNGSCIIATFPGGHVEKGETFAEAVIRAVYEEAGLTIENPLFCGVYHWNQSGTHYVTFLYQTDRYSGTLRSSEKGIVYWISMEALKEKKLAFGMEYVLQMMTSNQINECYMHLENGKYVGDL